MNDAIIKIDDRVDNAQGATILIDRERGLIRVRPKHRSREYVLPLGYVANMIVARVVKDELKR